MAFLDNAGVTRLVTDLKDRFAAISHNHSAADIDSGTLPIARGGTGVTANPSMLTNLGSTSTDDVLKASPRPGVTGTLPIANGGTGATTAAGAVENVVDGQALKPASVAATGEVSAKSGTTTHKLTEKAEDTRADNLEASLAYVESTTATTNHASGDYFMLGDVLMKATSAIATGEQITTSNATPATVQSQIDTLRDSVSALPKWAFESTVKRSMVLASATNLTDFAIVVEFNSGDQTALYVYGTSLQLKRKAAGSSTWSTVKTWT